MASLAGFFCDDDLAYAPFAALGWRVDAVDWQACDVEWRAYDAVVIRSSWDYHSDHEGFLGVLAAIEAAGTPLANSRSLVQWNLRKSYLHDLAARGVPVVPTLAARGGDAEQLGRWREALRCEEIVVKPLIGANAGHTYRLGREATGADLARVARAYGDNDYLVQPFMERVVDEGEYSLFYFNGAYSHAILKTPKRDDFRVQEDHGGRIRRVQPQARLVECGERTLATLPEPCLYARADFVRDRDGGFAIMELELIEPSLYLRMDPEAPARFARAFCEWFASR